MKIESVAGMGVVIDGSDIDTDRIIPARFLKEISFQNMGKYLFYDLRFDENNQSLDFPLNDKQYAGASILVVGENFGCGSSREHAPQAIKRYGFDAIIGVSFAEIFAGNCKSIGMPVVTMDSKSIESLKNRISTNPSTRIMLDLVTMRASFHEDSCRIHMAESSREAFLTGAWDVISLLKQNSEKVQKLSDSLPYLNKPLVH